MKTFKFPAKEIASVEGSLGVEDVFGEDEGRKEPIETTVISILSIQRAFLAAVIAKVTDSQFYFRLLKLALH